MTVFTDSAARRYANLARLAENNQRGHDAGYITHPPRTVEAAAARLVDSWFADRYGWPLTPRERAMRDDFLARVLHYAREGR